ncbi:MAG: amino acid transporter [Planctomycetota bacterium]|nr:MAG: amino acid transporter [Planctomycetota bacterium]
MSSSAPVTPTSKASHDRHYLWWLIMCLCGVDYFSTLGYQPSIAFDGAGTLSPIATILLVLVTLLGALPVYRYVAGETPDGVGSVGMIERLFRGWTGKIAVLVLIGFAATDFVITKTLSAADAAAHLMSNPLFTGNAPGWMQGQLGIAAFLLVLLGSMFLKGYDEVVGVATVLVTIYLGLTLIIILSGLTYFVNHPDLLSQWMNAILEGQYELAHPPVEGKGFWVILAIACIIFPKLALGMSGFETGVLHIHLVRGTALNPSDATARIANTRKLLLTASLIMSFFLIGSALITGTNTLIPAEELRLRTDAAGDVQKDVHGNDLKGKAVDRALAYLAHGESPHVLCPFFGPLFGTLYDISTILILWFAGASAMAGLLNMVPRYLPQYGMAPQWVSAYRPLVIAFTVINLIVTWCFQASVSAQGGAYATGVLVLMTSACVGSWVQIYRTVPESSVEGRRRMVRLLFFGLVAIVFFYTTIANMCERPDGVVIASIFILSVMIISLASRIIRSNESRGKGFRFIDGAAQMLWTDIVLDGTFRVLVPHRPSHHSLADKERFIRNKHRLPATVSLIFLEVHADDASNFYNSPLISIAQENGRFVIVAYDCVSVAHTISQIALEMSCRGDPLDIIFGWSKGNPLMLALSFVLFGQGDIPNLVEDLIEAATKDKPSRPTVIVG